MTRGISQADVFAAADQLLAAGDRPTVERIRATLGSGSPNTVIRYLDAWWADAGHRLNAKMTLPDMPSTVAELAGALWSEAFSAATQLAQASVVQAQADLASHRERLDVEHAARAAEAQHLTESLGHAEQLIDSQAKQLDAWVARARDWEGERDRMVTEAERAGALATQDRAALDALRDRYAALQLQTEQERTAAAEHVRLVEDRAHANVDAARQDVKTLRQQVAALQRDMSAQDTILAAERAAHAKALTLAERELAAVRAKAQTLDGALATFKASLRAVAPKKATRRPKTSIAKSKKP